MRLDALGQKGYENVGHVLDALMQWVGQWKQAEFWECSTLVGSQEAKDRLHEGTAVGTRGSLGFFNRAQ